MEDVLDAAARCGFEVEEVVEMPANNLSLVLRKTADGGSRLAST